MILTLTTVSQYNGQVQNEEGIMAIEDKTKVYWRRRAHLIDTGKEQKNFRVKKN